MGWEWVSHSCQVPRVERHLWSQSLMWLGQGVVFTLKVRDRKPQGFRDTPKVTENWQIQGLTSETPSNFGLAERPLPSPGSPLVQAFDGGVDWRPCLEPGGEGGGSLLLGV